MGDGHVEVEALAQPLRLHGSGGDGEPDRMVGGHQVALAVAHGGADADGNDRSFGTVEDELMGPGRGDEEPALVYQVVVLAAERDQLTSLVGPPLP